MNWATSLCETAGDDNANAATDAELDATMAWLSSGGDDGPYFQGTLRVLHMLVGAGRLPSTL